MFDDIKRYNLNRVEDPSKICPIDGLKIKLGIICKECGRTFCRRHREESTNSLKDLFTKSTQDWICPLCINNMKNFGKQSSFTELLKTGKVDEFMRKIF